MRGIRLLLILIILSSFAYSFEIEANKFETNICTPGTTNFHIHNFTDELEFIENVNTEIELINLTNSTALFELTHTPRCLQLGTVNVPIQIKKNNTITTTKVPLKINKDSSEKYKLNEQELTKWNILNYCNETKLDFTIENNNPYATLYKWKLTGDIDINKSLNIEVGGNNKQTTSFSINKTTKDFEIEFYNILTKKQYEYKFYVNQSSNCTELTITPTHVFEMNWPLLISLIILLLICSMIWLFTRPKKEKNEIIVLAKPKVSKKSTKKAKRSVAKSTKSAKN